MKITIVVGIQFSNEVLQLRDELNHLGHTISLPYTVEKIEAGELSFEKFMKEKKAHGDLRFRTMGPDRIKRYYNKIVSSDAILVANYSKNNIQNYIGGNALMEMGFAYVNDKKIFLLNDIPEMPYTDEIKAMNPVILKGNLSGIPI
ncbi:MAG: hypothetical protein WC495_03555 [Patescibacteria group bacterium]|jgi:hypothetical protein